MKAGWKKSERYSRQLLSNFQSYLQKNIESYYRYMCLAVTGSLAKYQVTPGSDIDILAITNNVVQAKHLKQQLGEAFHGNFTGHPMEFYPFQTLESWKDMTKNSLLYCSDLHFAKPVWGNSELFDELIYCVKNVECDYRNQINYAIYNILYRDRQYIQYKRSSNLKYQPGGLRDMQFIKWIAVRRGKHKSPDPVRYLKSLLDFGYLNAEECQLLSHYADAILAYKWRLESGKRVDNKSKQSKYFYLRPRVVPIIEQLKQKLLHEFEKDLGISWRQIVDRTRSGSLSDERAWSLVADPKQIESLIFCATWSTRDSHLLEGIYSQWENYWSVRMALAHNPSTPNTIISKLLNDMSDENSDIRKALSH